MRSIMRWTAAMLLLGAATVGAEDTILPLDRLDKAILIPAAEVGEVTVLGQAVPTSPEARRYRYSYRVFYREGFPSIFPYTPHAAEGDVPLVAIEIRGHPDCDLRGVTLPSRRQEGPWRWNSPRAGSLMWLTPARTWSAGGGELSFSFSSACAPGEGVVTAHLTREDLNEGTYGISGGVVAPMRPPVMIPRDEVHPGPPGRSGRPTYADPRRRR